jgi:transposase
MAVAQVKSFIAGFSMLYPDPKTFLALSSCPSAGWWSAPNGWLYWCRRLNVDYECLPASSEAFIHIAMIRLMLRRLA